jgi:tetratricopeptide (TPR) repeat protein
MKQFDTAKLRTSSPGALRWCGWALLGLLASTTASAADPDSAIAALEPAVANVAQKAVDIEDQLKPGRGFISVEEAHRAYEQHLYEFLLGEYHAAAEGFFTLVTTSALRKQSEHLDAEWYLAESLFELGNYDTAESRLKNIADDRAHPFHDDAVRRLLELYARSGQTEKFRAYFQLEIVGHNTKPSDIVTYTVGRTLWIQGDLAGAKVYFNDIPNTSSLYAKTCYMLGTIYVQQQELDEAVAQFRKVLDLSIKSTEDRQVLDLSLLALGRIAYERGDFINAAELYGRIGGDSRYQADKLYENVWTFIKQKDYAEALRAVDIFLLAFPEDANAAQLRLLEGHLKMAQARWQDALISYEQVIADYTPVRERFSELARQGENPADVFHQIDVMERNGVTGGGSLPPFALAKLAADPDVSKAMSVWKEVQRQQGVVTESEEIITQLSQVLGTAAHLGVYDQLYQRIRDVREQALRQRLEVIDAQEDWVASTTAGRKSAASLRKRRAALQDAVNGASANDPAAFDRLKSDTQALYEDLRAARPGGAADRTGARFDALDQALIDVESKLLAAKESVAGAQKLEIVRIKERLEYETGQVQTQRVDLDKARTDSDRVSLGLTRAGFARLEQFFTDSLMKADMGVVDVYWAEKVDMTDRRDAMAVRETELVTELEARFNLIRQKLPSEPLAAPGSATAPAAPTKEGP